MPPPHSLGEAEGSQRPRARDPEERRCSRSSEHQEHLCDASRSGGASRGTKPRSYLSLSFSHRLAKPGTHQTTACIGLVQRLSCDYDPAIGQCVRRILKPGSGAELPYTRLPPASLIASCLHKLQPCCAACYIRIVVSCLAALPQEEGTCMPAWCPPGSAPATTVVGRSYGGLHAAKLRETVARGLHLQAGGSTLSHNIDPEGDHRNPRQERRRPSNASLARLVVADQWGQLQLHRA